MSKITAAVSAFIADEDGVTAIEYGLIAALVGVAIVAGVGALGTSIDEGFKKIATKLTNSLSTL